MHSQEATVRATSNRVVWCGVTEWGIAGPYFFEETVSIERYWNILSHS